MDSEKDVKEKLYHPEVHMWSFGSGICRKAVGAASFETIRGTLAIVTFLSVVAPLPWAPSAFASGPEDVVASPAQQEQAEYIAAAPPTKPVSFDFKQTDILDVLRALAVLQNVTIIPDETVKGLVSVHVSDVDFEEGLRLLLDANGFLFTKPDSRTYVVRRKQAPLPYAVTAAGEKLDIVAENADLTVLLNNIAQVSGANIVPDASVSGKISVQVRGLPLDDALKAVLAPFGYSYTIDKSSQGPPVYYVSKAKPERVSLLTRPDGRLDLTLIDAPLADVAQALTARTGRNIVLGPEVQGNATVTLQNVTLETALDALFTVKGFKVRTGAEPNVFLVVREQDKPRTGIEALEYEDGLLSIGVRDVNVLTLAETLAERAGINILPDKDSVNATVTGSLRRLPLDQAIRVFFEANGFQVLYRDGLYLIRRSPLANAFTVLKNSSGTYDIDISSADLVAVLRELAAKAQVNIAIYGYVRGQLGSLHITGLTLEQAFEQVLKGTGYTYLKLGSIYAVGDASTTHPDATVFSTAALIPLQYITVDSLVSMLPASMSNQGLRSIRDQNAVVISGAPGFVEEVRSFIKVVDVPPTNQKAKIIRIDNADADEVGMLVTKQFPGVAVQVLRSRKSIYIRASSELMAEVGAFISDLDKPTGVITELIELRHIKADEAVRLLPPGLGKDGIIVVSDRNALLVSGDDAFQGLLRGYLAKLDVPTPQILFDVLIVEFLDNEAGKVGLNLSLNAGKFSLKSNPLNSEPLVGSWSPTASNVPSIALTINSLIQAGKAKVLANPKISVLSGRTATFSVTTKSRYWDPRFKQGDDSTGSGANSSPSSNNNADLAAFRTVETGIKLAIKPWVAASGEITMEIQPEISDTSGTSSSGLPQTNERVANTTVRVQDGETVIIGGLIQNIKHNNTNKARILGDLPVFGPLFRSEDTVESQSEFVIYITPHLVTSAAEANSLFRPAWSEAIENLDSFFAAKKRLVESLKAASER